MNVRTLNVSGSTTTNGITDNNTFLGIVANQLNVSNGLATGSLQVNYNSTMTGNLTVQVRLLHGYHRHLFHGGHLPSI